MVLIAVLVIQIIDQITVLYYSTVRVTVTVLPLNIFVNAKKPANRSANKNKTT